MCPPPNSHIEALTPQYLRIYLETGPISGDDIKMRPLGWGPNAMWGGKELDMTEKRQRNGHTEKRPREERAKGWPRKEAAGEINSVGTLILDIEPPDL